MLTCYRRLPKFDYAIPGSIDEALELLGDNRNGTFKVYAGGTDVIPKIKTRQIRSPEVLVDLKGIPGLDYIEYDSKNGLRIGALATIASVANSHLVKERFTILSRAADSIASTQVQNRGTIVGNICTAVPSADSAPALLALDAKLLCVRREKERMIEIKDFFKGVGQSALQPDELLKEIQVPPVPKKTNGIYIKLSPRRRMDLAVVGVAVLVSAEKGIFNHVRIALGVVAPTPIRAYKAETFLEGQAVSDDLIAKAALLASDECDPRSSHRASAEYRRMMVEVLVKRGIAQALSS